MKRFYIFIFLSFILNGYCQELSFENLQLKGLPSTEVYQLIQDKDGFIWMVTDAGVCRYDGSTLTTYTAKDGLPENVVLKMRQDSKKRIWFITLSNRLFYYDKGHFTAIAANNELKKIFLLPVVDFMIGEGDTLVLAYGGAGPSFLKIPPKDNYGTIIKTTDLLSKHDIRRYILQSKANPKEAVSTVSDYNSTNNSNYKIYLFDTILIASLKEVFPASIGHSNSGGVMIRSNGTVYFQAKNVLITVKNRKLISHFEFPNEIYKIYLDQDEDLWIGTRWNGVYFYKNADLSQKPIHLLTHLSVSSILQDKEGSVWVSTLEKGVFQCMNKYVRSIPERTADFKYFNNQLHVGFRSQKELLVSGIDSFNLKKPLPFFPENLEMNCFLKNERISYYCIFGALYGIRNNKVTKITNHLTNSKVSLPTKFLFNYSNDTILRIHLNSICKIIPFTSISSYFIPNYLINCALQLPNKHLLLGSRTYDGIYEYTNDTAVPYLNSIKELKTRINSLTIDKAGNLWVATNEKGVYCVDTKHHLYAFNETNGLISNKVNALAVDSTGNIWCGSFLGLSKINTSLGLGKTIIENFNKNHGIVDLEIEKLTCFDNAIWCGGKSTFFFFDLNKMQLNTFPPGLYVQSLRVKNKNYPISDSLFLNYDQNDFRIQFQPITYKKTNDRTFYYKLNGYDPNWNTSNTGDIQYTNIKYGTYTLLVYGVNNDGIKSKEPIKITFIIKRPFWFTWWFITFISILVVILIVLLARYWKHKIEKKERDKAAINQQLAEFKMTALRSQMNPHFIYNAIGSIQHYILKNEIDQSFNYLSKFSSLIRKILNNSRNEFISLEDEISTLKLYIELEQIRFKHPFKFILTIDEELDMDVDIPTMLIQPYIENSIWHGLMPKEKDGCLELTLKKVDAAIHIQIKDNGVGRETGEMKKKHHISKGMSLTEQRIQTLESTSNKKFVTNIIDLKDEMGNPIGTLVHLIIPFDE